MKIILVLKRLLFVLLLVLPVLAFSQEDAKPTRKQKKAEQKKEQRVQDAKKAELKGKKRHMKIQEKQVQKRMKKHKKKGTHYVSRRPGFFKRLLNKFK